MTIPRLTAEDFDHPERLAAKIDQVLTADDALRRRGLRIRRLQDRLRKGIPADEFGLYLAVEEAVNARGSRAVDVVTGWAFNEGVREGRKLAAGRRPRLRR
jgi:hypothetical protein